MKKKKTLKRMIGQAGDVAFELRSMHFSEFCPVGSWVPAMNAYRYQDRFELAVDLAGIEKKDVDVLVEPHRIVIKGKRPAPAPKSNGEEAQLISLEIENGPFCRTMNLPCEVDVEKASARTEHGLLWVILPFKVKGG